MRSGVPQKEGLERDALCWILWSKGQGVSSQRVAAVTQERVLEPWTGEVAEAGRSSQVLQLFRK